MGVSLVLRLDIGAAGNIVSILQAPVGIDLPSLTAIIVAQISNTLKQRCRLDSARCKILEPGLTQDQHEQLSGGTGGVEVPLELLAGRIASVLLGSDTVLGARLALQGAELGSPPSVTVKVAVAGSSSGGTAGSGPPSSQPAAGSKSKRKAADTDVRSGSDAEGSNCSADSFDSSEEGEDAVIVSRKAKKQKQQQQKEGREVFRNKFMKELKDAAVVYLLRVPSGKGLRLR